jgi:hypothetical protein
VGAGLREGKMSYAEQLQKLAAVERDLQEMYRDLGSREGELFDGALESLLDQLYGAHASLCCAAASPPRSPPPRTT